MAIQYTLSRSQVEDFGGEVAIAAQLTADGKVFSGNRAGEYVLQQTWQTPMRVMFLPEELKVATAALGGEAPKIARFPVNQALQWNDAV